MRRRCLILTPATRWRSWVWLEKVMAATDDEVSWLVVSYGKPRTTRSNVRVLALPAVNYAGLGRLMSRRPWWLLNLLHYVPLSPLAWVAGAVTRPYSWRTG